MKTNNKYKVLVHQGGFVDETLLIKGIYYTKIPSLHDENETIESMVIKTTQFYESIGRSNNNSAIENLRKCKLEDYYIYNQPSTKSLGLLTSYFNERKQELEKQVKSRSQMDDGYAEFEQTFNAQIALCTEFIELANSL